MAIGLHLSIAGGYGKAVERAEEAGAECLQIFCRNPRSWKIERLDEKAALEFALLRKKSVVTPLVVHASYLINLSSAKSALFNKSLGLFTEELRIAGAIGADYYVLHPGSYGTNGTLAKSIEQVAYAIKSAAKASGAKHTRILIENTAGGGTQTGATLESIGKIIKLLEPDSAGLCFDTCHAFASGAGLHDDTGAKKLIKSIDSTVGLKNLRLIHLNESKGGFTSRLDRHEHLWKGKIGLTAIKDFVAHPLIRKVPMILETPKEKPDSDAKNLKIANSLRRNE